MRSGAAWLERHQLPFYLSGLALGAVLGLTVPAVARPAELLITPVLGVLLYATFLGVPFARTVEAVRDVRFLGAALTVNFVLVPVVVWLLSRMVAADEAVLVGVLFVLLTPCVDYVIVFTGLAGGARDRLLAAAPVLMIAQMLLLPFSLWLFVGPEFAARIDIGPFVEAFLLLIVLPLAAAAVTQVAAARTRAGAAVQQVTLAAMVPLLAITLAVVVASQIAAVSARIGSLMLAIPVFVAFAVIMAPLADAVGRAVRLDVPGRRALVFSGATRNSLVVLPLVLALPAAFDLSALVVVTQTLVELLLMLVFVRVVPRLVRHDTRPESPRAGR